MRRPRPLIRHRLQPVTETTPPTSFYSRQWTLSRPDKPPTTALHRRSETRWRGRRHGVSPAPPPLPHASPRPFLGRHMTKAGRADTSGVTPSRDRSRERVFVLESVNNREDHDVCDPRGLNAQIVSDSEMIRISYTYISMAHKKSFS
jgi:hypothetical protein